ncbi:PREDICTED: ubiquitin carboxyl-terminal hydrolase 14-like [Priapulus caudatus]|uniref:Ubiquitin carboxyl-terminal hydrolase n=1 Tax=Priapulus caudatus TaxID=37621 RepID=A0ABM1E644_PRICU|nr:PREDICTED: ubiquitin carboxyl-terminal hydrolase 14-like [Priapulus caudatus]
MPSYKVKVKWGKEKFEDVECNMDEPPVLFKAQMFALSGVEPDRQKVMLKGAVLKDDDWGNLKIKDGTLFLMMGSAGELPTEPREKPKFVEDMSETQLASALSLPAGLNNLGNTCYMNATVQCLHSVPELRDALKRYQGRPADASNPAASITASLKDLFDTLEKTSQDLPPIVLLHFMHLAFPRFAEKSEHGGFQQQDANECWTEMVRVLQQQVPLTAAADGTLVAAASPPAFMDHYFGGKLESVLKCVECDEEQPTTSNEDFFQLSCFISQDVKYLHTGLKSRMEENITKMSSVLGRDAEYHKTSQICRLPGYLTIQFVRFFYKEKGAINAKILKDVKFTMMLDVFDLCTPELQQKLIPLRTRFKEQEDKQLELTAIKKDKSEVKEETMEVDKVEKKTRSEPYSFEDDVGSNNSGYYELRAVLTHKGRSSSSGHYVAWVRKSKSEWTMFDDDNVSAVSEEDILKLSGGGDWHTAYVLLYGPRILEVEEE